MKTLKSARGVTASPSPYLRTWKPIVRHLFWAQQKLLKQTHAHKNMMAGPLVQPPQVGSRLNEILVPWTLQEPPRNQLPSRVVARPFFFNHRICASSGSNTCVETRIHITTSCTILMLWPCIETTMLWCARWTINLDGSAMRWFSDFPPYSINNFKTFVDMFTKTFIIYRDVRKLREAIFSMKPQSKNKSLRNYLKQFRTELAEVEKPNDRLATMAFK